MQRSATSCFAKHIAAFLVRPFGEYPAFLVLTALLPLIPDIIRFFLNEMSFVPGRNLFYGTLLSLFRAWLLVLPLCLRQHDRGGEILAVIIGKTKCDEIKNEMRPSWRKAWSKRNATKISHTRKNTVRTTTKRCSNGIFLSQKQRSLRSLLVIANHPLLLSTTTRFRGTDGPLDAVDDPPVALGVSVDHIERKHRQHKLSLHCLE